MQYVSNEREKPLTNQNQNIMKTNNYTKKFLVRHRHPLVDRLKIAEMMNTKVDHSWRESSPVNIQRAVEGANHLRKMDYEVEINEIER